jgi:hypothetical protein
VFDLGFLLAVGALGWGLSLATYRAFAAIHDWPMGRWQADRPHLPIVIGVVCVLAGALVAFARISSGDTGIGVMILLFGLAWAVFWTGFLHTGAQSALLLAPVAALILLVRAHG